MASLSDKGQAPSSESRSTDYTAVSVEEGQVQDAGDDGPREGFCNSILCCLSGRKEREIQGLRESCERQKAQIQQLETENADAKRKNEQLQEEKDDIKEGAEKLKKECAEKEAHVQRLQEEKAKEEANGKELEEKCNEKESTIEWLQENHAEQETRISDLEWNWTAVTNERNRFQNELAARVKKIRELERNISEMEVELYDCKIRLSEMASERMREGNECVEDLNDPYRPTAIADKWNSLFRTGEYWTAYEKIIERGKDDTETANLLNSISKTVYETCAYSLEEFVPRAKIEWPLSDKKLQPEDDEILLQKLNKNLPDLRRKLQELLPNDADRVNGILEMFQAEYKETSLTEVPKIQQKLRKAVCQLPKTSEPPAAMKMRVLEAIRDDEAIDVDLLLIEKFVLKLLQLCYVMRLQEVPLAVNFGFSPGSQMDRSLFEIDGTSSTPLSDSRIKSILRPPLLRRQGGAVLSKGEVDLIPASQNSASQGNQEINEHSQPDEKATDSSDADSYNSAEDDNAQQGKSDPRKTDVDPNTPLPASANEESSHGQEPDWNTAHSTDADNNISVEDGSAHSEKPDLGRSGEDSKAPQQPSTRQSPLENPEDQQSERNAADPADADGDSTAPQLTSARDKLKEGNQGKGPGQNIAESAETSSSASGEESDPQSRKPASSESDQDLTTQPVSDSQNTQENNPSKESEHNDTEADEGEDFASSKDGTTQSETGQAE